MASAAPGNAPEFSVSEIAFAVKRTVEDAFGNVRVRGELSGVKRAASGHLYLALKDENAVLDGVMWKGPAGALKFRPEDGLEVIATGKMTTYPGRSKYQLVIERMEPAGAGALMALLEERKKKLAAEGLFAAERKRPLPFIPRCIGVVTSPTGAVIRDILHRLADRFPRPVVLWPVLVQGEGAAEQVARAVRGFAAGGPFPTPDLIIIARGGGSIEDLWAFNEEIVVRAVAESPIPVISAVGHETDTTLCDFAADRRAPTPTAAAEMAVPVRDDLLFQVGDLGLRMGRAMARARELRGERLGAVAARLPSPRALLALKAQRADDVGFRLPRALNANTSIHAGRYQRSGAVLRPALLVQRRDRAADVAGLVGQKLGAAYRAALARRQSELEADKCRIRPFVMQAIVDRKTARVTELQRVLASLDPKATLKRGYAVVTDGAGRYITGVAAAKAAGAMTLEFADGEIGVATGAAPGDGAPRRSSARPGVKPQGTQGDLF